MVLDLAPRRLILTLYGLYGREEHNWLSVSSVVRLMDDLGVGAPAVRSSISRLKRRGVLEPMKANDAAGYVLSADALELLREGDRRIFGPRRATEADGLVLVVFSVPESERDRRHQLRRLLTGLGFGTVSPGVWVAPALVQQETTNALRSRGLAPYADVFTASLDSFSGLAERVQQWWDLDAIDAEYSAFLDTFASVRSDWTSSQDARRAFEVYVPMLTVWRRLPYLDPGLPATVLPPGWSGTRAVELFADLDALLRQPARSHALSVIHG